MYYVLFRKTENLTPDEQRMARRGGIWLHTGVTGRTRAEAMAEVKRLKSNGEGFLGLGCKLKVMSEEQLSR